MDSVLKPEVWISPQDGRADGYPDLVPIQITLSRARDAGMGQRVIRDRPEKRRVHWLYEWNDPRYHLIWFWNAMSISIGQDMNINVRRTAMRTTRDDTG